MDYELTVFYALEIKLDVHRTFGSRASEMPIRAESAGDTLDISLCERRIRSAASNKFMSHGAYLSLGDSPPERQAER